MYEGRGDNQHENCISRKKYKTAYSEKQDLLQHFRNRDNTSCFSKDFPKTSVFPTPNFNLSMLNLLLLWQVRINNYTVYAGTSL